MKHLDTLTHARGRGLLATMQGFVEKFCEHAGIVRVGPDAHKFGDPYDYSVTYVIRDGVAELVGFSHGNLQRWEYTGIIELVNAATGLLTSYQRISGDASSRVTQVDPRLTKGRIVMSKHKHRSVSEAKNHDGTINQTIVVIHTLEALQAIMSGNLIVLEMHENPVPGHSNQIEFRFKARAVPEGEPVKPLA